MLIMNVFAQSSGSSSNGRDNRTALQRAIDNAASSGRMPRDAQNAMGRTRRLIQNNSGGIVAGGNQTTVSLRGRRMPRDTGR